MNRSILGLAGAALAVLALTCGCQRGELSPATQSTTSAEAAPSLLVDADWLNSHLQDADFVVLDVRTADEYTAGHIPGAVSLPHTMTYDVDPDRVNDLAPVSRIEAVFGAAGIDLATRVVIYDGRDYREAGRMFWTLEVHGHQRVSVLNGGFGDWVRRGLAVSTKATLPEPKQFVANLEPRRLASKLRVLRSLGNPGVTILDVRSRDEYLGLKSEAARAGHIPSAVQIDFQEGLERVDDVCYVKDAEGLRVAYAGLTPDGSIITYCNTGTRASASYLALRMLGREVAVYDGAWTEWAGDAELPIEVAPTPAPLAH